MRTIFTIILTVCAVAVDIMQVSKKDIRYMKGLADYNVYFRTFLGFWYLGELCVLLGYESGFLPGVGGFFLEVAAYILIEEFVIEGAHRLIVRIFQK